MSKKFLYRYNPETDNFERYFPPLKSRMASLGGIIISSILLAFIFIFIFDYLLASPSEKNLREENRRLKSQYGVLSRRLENMLEVMDRIGERDDNFYRVMMQIEPMSESQRNGSLGSETRYRELRKMSDARLVDELTKRMNLLERRIYSQIQSFDQLRVALGDQQHKLAHIPSVIPINIEDYTMSSGYGWRRDPIYGASKFHEGLDFAASTGTNVFATADGTVKLARRQAGYGNCVEIDHGYNYMTRYAHLSEIDVKEGEEVKRGQFIGKVGSTGKSTGPHLHYEVRYKDMAQNPVNYYFMDLTPDEYYEMIKLAENAGHVMD